MLFLWCTTLAHATPPPPSCSLPLSHGRALLRYGHGQNGSSFSSSLLLVGSPAGEHQTGRGATIPIPSQ